MNDPYTPVQSAAIQLHELMEALIAVGFTRKEAYGLTRETLKMEGRRVR